MTEATIDVTDRIAAFKQSLGSHRGALARAFAEVKEHVRRA